MILIVGWGGGVTQDLGEVAPTVCPRCHNEVFLHEIRSNKQFSVYFVPIVPYDSNAYLACPICHTGMPLKADQIGAAERMRATTQRFRRHRLAEPAYRVAIERFWATFGLAPTGAQVLHPAPTIPPPVEPARVPSLPDQLAGIAKLHADGLLTDDQFAAAKRRVLEG